MMSAAMVYFLRYSFFFMMFHFSSFSALRRALLALCATLR